MTATTSPTTEAWESCLKMAQNARTASRVLATCTRSPKDAWLLDCAAQLELQKDRIIAANQLDLEAATELPTAMRERLKLNESRLQQAADSLRQVAHLPDPVGRIRSGETRPNGLQVQKITTPLGVIFFLYESRPNVTIDAAALCVKSGNAVILRGGKEALHSNHCLHQLMVERLPLFDLPQDAVQLVTSSDRTLVSHFLQMDRYIDLAIPRGGESLIRRVVSEAKMPVLKHYLGNCHVYVDRAAPLQMAEEIIINSKCQRPGVCNAMESLLIHEDLADSFVSRIGAKLREHNVEIRACEITKNYLSYATNVTESDYAAEFCDLIVSMKVVSSIDAAIDHIRQYGSGHTEAIVTMDLAAANHFVRSIDASAVMVNASTRFNDGFELGLGAEIGISTDKMHARGPCGLEELTSYKYVVTGNGQIRS
ncbi:MAG: glutamate-5-semialdehyde dehydrogenase [Zavarzinella sp.]